MDVGDHHRMPHAGAWHAIAARRLRAMKALGIQGRPEGASRGRRTRGGRSRSLPYEPLAPEALPDQRPCAMGSWKHARGALVLSLIAGSLAAGPEAAADAKVDVPFTRYALDNGLTVILHEDH